MSPVRVLTPVFALWVTSACASVSERTEAGPSTAADPGSAPASATCAGVPDSIPLGWLIPRDSVEAVFAPENMVVAHPRRNGPYPRDLVVVGFRRGASEEEKRAAMERIGGCVIGGDGTFLYVRVMSGGGDAPVWWASDALMKLPQVHHAGPIQLHWQPAERVRR